MKSLLQMLSPKIRASIYYACARSWGIIREKLKLKYEPDSEVCGGLSWLWAVDDPIFNKCFASHDRHYQTLKPGESSLEGDLRLKDCLLLQAYLFELGEVKDPWSDS